MTSIALPRSVVRTITNQLEKGGFTDRFDASFEWINLNGIQIVALTPEQEADEVAMLKHIFGEDDEITDTDRLNAAQWAMDNEEAGRDLMGDTVAPESDNLRAISDPIVRALRKAGIKFD